MRFGIIGVFLLLTVNTLQECRGQSIFRTLADDIKCAAEKIAHYAKRGAEDVAHDFKADVAHVAAKVSEEVKDAAAGSGDILKKVGIDVDKVVKVVRHDVYVGWVKAKPYMKEAFIFIDGIMKSLGNVEETSESIDILKDSKEKVKTKK